MPEPTPAPAPSIPVGAYTDPGLVDVGVVSTVLLVLAVLVVWRIWRRRRWNALYRFDVDDTQLRARQEAIQRLKAAVLDGPDEPAWLTAEHCDLICADTPAGLCVEYCAMPPRVHADESWARPMPPERRRDLLGVPVRVNLPGTNTRVWTTDRPIRPAAPGVADYQHGGVHVVCRDQWRAGHPAAGCPECRRRLTPEVTS